MIYIRWCHHLSTISGIQLTLYRFHCDLSLLFGSMTGDNCPSLWIEPHTCFRIVLGTDQFAGILKSTIVAVIFPPQIVDLIANLFLCLIQICNILCIVLLLCKVTHDRKCIVKLQCYERRLTLCTKTETIVPVCMQSCRKAVWSQMVH